MGVFEFERVRQLIGLYVMHTSVIADVGGGTGKYAEWLSLTGHKVYVVEPVENEESLFSLSPHIMMAGIKES